MGKIFGISDLPVSTIHSTLQAPNYELITENTGTLITKPEYNMADKFVSTQKTATKLNPIVKMRNGIGKLMKHFSKVKPR